MTTLSKLSFALMWMLCLITRFSCSLKIWNNSFASPHSLFHHTAAAFGASPFNISGRLVLMTPIDGCNISNHTCNNSIDSIYQNQIVLILRGSCSFATKVYNAQQQGAIGAIIGD